jgi:hypothetical protein
MGRFSELRHLSEHFEARKARARERLKTVSDASWYLALVGLEVADADPGRMEPLARFQPVTEPPGEVELASACKDPGIFSAVGRYSQGIRFELALTRGEISDQGLFNTAWWIISALRVRTCAEFLVVAVSDRSWSTLAAIEDRSCQVQLLEDHPLAHRFEPSNPVTAGDLTWVGEHIFAFADLLENSRFRLAVDAVCTHHHIASPRMSAAMLWSGIEALFSIAAELRFRLAAGIAAILESPGAQRAECYRRVKKLYDFRSKIVHGAAVSQEDISEHIIEVRSILVRLICAWVDSGLPFDDVRIEGLLFG